MRRTAIFFSAGLGNALLAQPLIKRLKERGDHITGIFTTDWGGYEVYEGSSLLDQQISLTKNRNIAGFGLKFMKRFGDVYVDFFASSRKHLLLANMIGQRIITNKLPTNIPTFLRPLIRFRRPGFYIHEGTQYLRLIDREARDEQLLESQFQLPLKPELLIKALNHKLPRHFIPVQITGGNNKAQYKSWSYSQWSEFLAQASKALPEVTFVLLGDQHETAVANELLAEHPDNTRSLVGKTNLDEVMLVLLRAQMYLGIDSGLMHLSVALGLPTFCIWGGSDHRLFGYQKINANRHTIVSNEPACWPCNSYLAPNTSKASDPTKCPDFACLQQLKPGEVFEQFQLFYEQHATH